MFEFDLVFGIILLLVFAPVVTAGVLWNARQEQNIMNGAVLELPTGKLRVQYYNDQIVRVTFAPTDQLLNKKSLVVLRSPQPLDLQIREAPETISIWGKKLRLTVSLQSGSIQFSDANGQLILREKAEEPHRLVQAEVMGEQIYHATQRFELHPEEAIYGLGQHQTGDMNYRGKKVILVQTNTAAVNPFLISTKGYGILWDNYSKTIVHDDENGLSFWSEVADQIDYYFIAGQIMDEVISGYRWLTGEAPLFGKWAYGYWQSKERYVDAKELVATVAEFRRQGIPLDNIVQDWRYWGENEYWSSMKFDETIFPEPEKMIERLHNEFHVHLMTSIWPSLGEKTEIYQELKQKGFIYPPKHWIAGYVYDAYSEEAREIYWRYIKEGLIARGVDALWMDATEPELGDQHSYDVSEQYLKRFGRTALGSFARYLNPYSLMTTEGVYQGFRRDFPNKRVFILTRSAFAGQQRNAAATWSGDISATWEVFRKQISAGINFCMSGIPYWTHDIGAFFTSSRGGLYPAGCKDPAYQELYVRWFQFGAFTPIFRSHGTGTPREPWQFGKPRYWAYDALLKFLHLRYRLLPYIYSIAWRVTSEGYTMMRGLAMDFASDTFARGIDNQYLFGPSFLVAPVTEAMYYEPAIPSPIPNQCLFAHREGPNGLQAEYFAGADFDHRVNTRIDSVVNFNWSGSRPENCPIENYSIRWTGEILPTETGNYEIGVLTDDGARLWLDDQLIIDAWQKQAMTYYSKQVQLTQNRRYKIKLEYFQAGGDAVIKLVWRTPVQQQQLDQLKVKSLKVYLPKCAGWYDFWTGELIRSGGYVERAAPVDIMPLYVKSGSIIPMGPLKQYATEKPEDPIELRIYPGADARFVLYEDENENYNYEQGVYSIIPFEWDEAKETLTIGARQGEFPGMLKQREIRIVWVQAGHGVGVEVTAKPDVVVQYTGQKRSIKKPH
ncbi:MAG: PA14 domain-containing protein [candidate division KSB1 bacterium]|nr:PA14 domain-containing protein [candidate division KSB1 bacterium]MDZ7358475.1 PA14 domain-containing protein [candidate division KSB1 bacterium]MDZ7399117.1 PA14 domain-containing protein [candidate division KSB1 bacterium]